MIKFNYDNIYSLSIFVLPLIGILASNIYTSLKAKTWYSNLKIMMPDIFNGSYGLYITSFIFLFTGMSLFLLLQIIEGKDYILEDTDKLTTTWKKSTDIDMIMLWLIPIIFFLIYIINPIMYQVQNTLPGAIMYVFVLLLLIVFTIYTVKFSVYICIFLIPLLIWAFYMTLFLFTITDPSKIVKNTYITPDIKNNLTESFKPVNISTPNNSTNLFNNAPVPTINNKPTNQNPQYQIKTGKHLNIIDNTIKK
jgi:tryptophan-rich sensory protein